MADLHLGKRVNDFSMTEDQDHILKQAIDIIEDEDPAAVLIAGDVYDRSVPPAEAVILLDRFLSALAAGGRKVFIISGNHDSAERLSFGSELMRNSGIYFSQTFDGEIPPVTLEDEEGPVDIYMLPFIKPATVRAIFPDEEVSSYTDAVKSAVNHMALDPQRRNVLLAHQFVTGGSKCDSEEVSVGGLDNVDADAFEGFNYVALGHLHGPQNINEHIRYAGSPLKYSFSEAAHKKSVTIVNLDADGNAEISERPLVPIRDMIRLRGTYEELTSKAFADTQPRDAYIDVTLTDEDEEPEAMPKLRTIYPNIMRLSYDNARTRADEHLEALGNMERMDPVELVSAFYEKRNGAPMSEEQAGYIGGLLEDIWEA